jgi:acetolactate synthase-1/2/3 large subunit
VNDLFNVEGSEQKHVLVASCLGDATGGGLVSFDGTQIEVIDKISSTGLSVAEGRLLRLLWCRGDFLAPGELLVSDRVGIERYHRIDELNDPHDVLFDGENYVIASAGENSILWVGKTGELVRKEKMPGEPDSWHINGLLIHQGDLYVTAFGRFNAYREWSQHSGEGCGIVFNQQTGRDVLVGLEMPHHPRILDDSWIVCNSGTYQLLQFELKTGRQIRQLQLRNWTRGLAFSDKYIFVGESANRYRPQRETRDPLASIVILDRSSWKVVFRIALPFQEIYDLLLIPQQLLDGVRRGFNTNPQRMQEHNQHALFSEIGISPDYIWASGDLLPKEACATSVSVDIEHHLRSNSVLQRPCVITNRGMRILTSAKPRPVFLIYRWLSKDTGTYVDEFPIGTRLPFSIPPGASASCSVRFRTPETAGHYELEVSLFQKGRGFFGDIDRSNCFRTTIRVDASHTD